MQNVFYRDWMVEQARARGRRLVRNRADGSVEAVVEGAAEMVATIVERARQGPPAARVTEVTVSADAPAETLDGFATRATA